MNLDSMLVLQSQLSDTTRLGKTLSTLQRVVDESDPTTDFRVLWTRLMTGMGLVLAWSTRL